MKKFILLIAGMIFSTLYAQNSTQEIINKAIAASPQIKMLQSELRSAAYNIDAGSNLPDPSLTVGLANMPVNSFSFTQEPMTGKVIGLSQAFPFPGKLSDREEYLAKDTAVIKQDIEEAKNRLALQVKTSLYRLAYIKEALRIAEKKRELFTELSGVVQTQYSVGEVSQQDAFRVDYELTGIADNISSLKADSAAITETIRSYLMDKDYTILPAELKKIDSLEVPVSGLKELAELYRPVLLKNRVLIEKAEKNIKLANNEFYPDFKVSVQYNQRESLKSTGKDLTDFFSVSAGMNIPINYGGKKTAAVNKAKAGKEQLEQKYKSNLQLLEIELVNSIEKIKNLVERKNYIEKGYSVQSYHTFESALSSYQVGKVDFINVVRSVNEIFKSELDLAKVKADYWSEVSKIEYLTGTELKGIKEN